MKKKEKKNSNVVSDVLNMFTKLTIKTPEQSYLVVVLASSLPTLKISSKTFFSTFIVLLLTLNRYLPTRKWEFYVILVFLLSTLSILNKLCLIGVFMVDYEHKFAHWDIIIKLIVSGNEKYRSKLEAGLL